jgi:hypothetical protein
MDNNVLTKIVKPHDCEVDWLTEFSVYGLNLSTMQFENTTYIPANTLIAVNIFHNIADYSEDIAEEAKEKEADFLLYDDSHFVVGYVKI